MKKVEARVDAAHFNHIKKQLGLKTNQAVIEYLMRYYRQNEANKAMGKHLKGRLKNALHKNGNSKKVNSN